MVDDTEKTPMSSHLAIPNTEAAILSRLIQAKDSQSQDVARYLLSIDFESSDVDRMNFLAERGREGNLTVKEAAELDSYLHVGSLLSIVQSKARRVLKSQDSVPHAQ